MTDDEKRQQKAMLLLEYQEAEDNLAHLLEQAKRKAAAFKEVAVWLDDVAVDVKSYDPRENRRFDANLRANFQLYTDMVNLNAALASFS